MFPQFGGFSAEFPWTGAALAVRPANGTRTNEQSSANYRHAAAEAPTTHGEHRKTLFRRKALFVREQNFRKGAEKPTFCR